MQIWHLTPYKNHQSEIRHFLMHHTKRNGETVELGICQRGNFGPASVGSCSKLIYRYVYMHRNLVAKHPLQNMQTVKMHFVTINWH